MSGNILSELLSPRIDPCGILGQMTKVLKRKIPRLCTAHKERSECLIDQYEKQFESNHDIINQEIFNLVSQIVWNSPIIDKIVPTSPMEVLQCITKLKNRKIPGMDKIMNKCIKDLPSNIIFFITALINSIFKCHHLLEQWKSFIIVPIHKPVGDASCPSNYRPISLLSALSKITGRITHSKLNRFLNRS